MHNCRQASDSQLITSWVSPEQESRPCHVCPWAVGMVTGRSVSRPIRDWVVVHRHWHIAGYKIVNIYKPPHSRLILRPFWRFHTPVYTLVTSIASMSTGVTTSLDGESLDSWATSNNLGLLYNPKETASFFSRCWNVGTNPVMVFTSFRQDSQLLDRCVLGQLPRPQHWPSLITPPRFKVPAHSDPVKRWNFRKAYWKRFCLLTGESVERLPPPDTPGFLLLLLYLRPLSLLYPSPSGDCLWQSRIIPTLSTTTEKVGAMGGSCQLHQLLALQPQGVENHQQTYWQVWMLLSPVPHLDKFHRLATREERGTQDRRPRVHQTRQLTVVQPMEDSNTWGSQYLWILQVGRVCCCPQMPEARKVSGIGFHLPRVYTPRQVCSQILVLQLPQFLHAPTQNSKDLEKSTSSCDP